MRREVTVEGRTAERTDPTGGTKLDDRSARILKESRGQSAEMAPARILKTQTQISEPPRGNLKAGVQAAPLARILKGSPIKSDRWSPSVSL